MKMKLFSKKVKLPIVGKVSVGVLALAALGYYFWQKQKKDTAALPAAGYGYMRD